MSVLTILIILAIGGTSYGGEAILNSIEIGDLNMKETRIHQKGATRTYGFVWGLLWSNLSIPISAVKPPSVVGLVAIPT